MEDFKFEMETVVEDSVTGFKGAIIARADYLASTNLYLVQPNCDGQANQMHKSKWLEEGRLK